VLLKLVPLLVIFFDLLKNRLVPILVVMKKQNVRARARGPLFLCGCLLFVNAVHTHTHTKLFSESESENESESEREG